MKTFFRLCLCVIGTILLTNATYLWVVSNFNLGLLLLTLLGVSVLTYSAFMGIIHKLLSNRIGAIIKCFLVLICAYFLFVSTLIATSAARDTANYSEEAVIVLGAGVHGEIVSKVLAYRLDAAVKYHKSNPKAYIIVSGGQGAQELITEAEAMERYLVQKGVNPEKIIKEERATSTLENFKYSKEILDKKFSDDYNVAYITNGFHLFRAGRLAKSAGLSAKRVRANSAITTLLPDYLRECLAIGAMWVKGN